MEKHSFDEVHSLFGNKFLVCRVIAARANELLSNEAFMEWYKSKNFDLYEYIINEFQQGKIKLTSENKL